MNRDIDEDRIPDLPLVIVEWCDAFCDDDNASWMWDSSNVETLAGEKWIRTVGALVHQSRRYVTVVQSYHGDPGIAWRGDRAFHIPRGVIKRIVPLQIADEVEKKKVA